MNALRFPGLWFGKTTCMKTNILLMLPMRLWLAGLLAASIGNMPLMPSAFAQGRGVIEGKVVNRTNPSILAAGVDLNVVELAGGMSIIKSAATDASGKFHIEGLPTDASLMIRAIYQSANYNSQVRFDATGKASVEIGVFETTKSRAGIREEGLQLAFQLAGDQLQTLETVSFNNETQPPRTFVNPDGTYRFPKLPDISEPPVMTIQAPGGAAPVTQSPLESPDGMSYYSLYPLRPGVTTFEVQGVLPYTERKYVYRRKFSQDLDSIELAVTPQDIRLLGEGIKTIQVDSQNNFVVYSAGPIKAGTEVVWTFSGGTPSAEPETTESSEGIMVRPVGTPVVRNALIIGPLLLMGFLAVLWYAFNRIYAASPEQRKLRMRELKNHRDQLLSHLASLDRRYEDDSLDRREYLREREQDKRRLRRISLLMRQ
jgi:hypothetical protein